MKNLVVSWHGPLSASSSAWSGGTEPKKRGRAVDAARGEGDDIVICAGPPRQLTQLKARKLIYARKVGMSLFRGYFRRTVLVCAYEEDAASFVKPRWTRRLHSGRLQPQITWDDDACAPPCSAPALLAYPPHPPPTSAFHTSRRHFPGLLCVCFAPPERHVPVALCLIRYSMTLTPMIRFAIGLPKPDEA